MCLALALPAWASSPSADLGEDGTVGALDLQCLVLLVAQEAVGVAPCQVDSDCQPGQRCRAADTAALGCVPSCVGAAVPLTLATAPPCSDPLADTADCDGRVARRLADLNCDNTIDAKDLGIMVGALLGHVGGPGSIDFDADGKLDYCDDDSDGDTIPDVVETLLDTDGDGAPNALDLDADGDGTLDAVELTGDIDQDGIPNFLDPVVDVNCDVQPNPLGLGWDPDHSGAGIVVSADGQVATRGPGVEPSVVRASPSLFRSAGRWYWELVPGTGGLEVGIGLPGATTDAALGQQALGYPSALAGGWQSPWAPGDVIGVAWDADLGYARFAKNGEWLQEDPDHIGLATAEGTYVGAGTLAGPMVTFPGPTTGDWRAYDGSGDSPDTLIGGGGSVDLHVVPLTSTAALVFEVSIDGQGRVRSLDMASGLAVGAAVVFEPGNPDAPHSTQVLSAARLTPTRAIVAWSARAVGAPQAEGHLRVVDWTPGTTPVLGPTLTQSEASTGEHGIMGLSETEFLHVFNGAEAVVFSNGLPGNFQAIRAERGSVAPDGAITLKSSVPLDFGASKQPYGSYGSANQFGFVRRGPDDVLLLARRVGYANTLVLQPFAMHLKLTADAVEPGWNFNVDPTATPSHVRNLSGGRKYPPGAEDVNAPTFSFLDLGAGKAALVFGSQAKGVAIGESHNLTNQWVARQYGTILRDGPFVPITAAVAAADTGTGVIVTLDSRQTPGTLQVDVSPLTAALQFEGGEKALKLNTSIGWKDWFVGSQAYGPNVVIGPSGALALQLQRLDDATLLASWTDLDDVKQAHVRLLRRDHVAPGGSVRLRTTLQSLTYPPPSGFLPLVTCPEDACGEDTDNDGAGQACDVCPSVAAPGQLDGDGDGHGDACDVCPTVPDPNQWDFNHDGIGEACAAP